MKKLLTFVLALLPMIAMAQEQLNVTVDSVGQLETKIEESVRTKISELKVSGPLNGKDIKLLQEIVNRTKFSKKKGECPVVTVDLSEATIEAGKEGMKTVANTMPNGMFSGAKHLLKAVLPKNIVNISKDCFSGCSGGRHRERRCGIR